MNSRTEIVHDACERIETHPFTCSCCWALYLSDDRENPQPRLNELLGKFYDKSTGKFWFSENARYKQERILLLLLFDYAYDDILGANYAANTERIFSKPRRV